MRYGHLIFGALAFVVFLTTGQYMRADFPDKEAIPPDLRLLMRSRHIYILFSALIHLVLGLYLQTGREYTWSKIIQVSGSILLFIGTGLLVWGFVAETYWTRTFSEVSRQGIYLNLGGVAGHVFGRVAQALGK